MENFGADVKANNYPTLWRGLIRTMVPAPAGCFLPRARATTANTFACTKWNLRHDTRKHEGPERQRNVSRAKMTTRTCNEAVQENN